jgi:hypothetical protein
MANFSYRTHLGSCLLSLSLLAGIAALAGCGAPTLEAVSAQVATPGEARVVLDRIDGKTFELTVINESRSSLVVYRDRVLLNTPGGARSRIPGGLSNLYVIPAGGSHALHVAFDLSGLAPKQSVFVTLNGALEIEGRPVSIQPIEAVVN